MELLLCLHWAYINNKHNNRKPQTTHITNKYLSLIIVLGKYAHMSNDQ